MRDDRAALSDRERILEVIRLLNLALEHCHKALAEGDGDAKNGHDNPPTDPPIFT